MQFVMIRFFLEGKTVTEIHEKIFPTLGDLYSSYEAVRHSVMSTSAGEYPLNTRHVLED